jgi:hypothetical protein
MLASAILLTSMIGAVSARQAADDTDLSLPPFSIFGLDSNETIISSSKPLSSKELEKLIAAVEKSRAAGGANATRYYRVVPVVFHRMRGLFTKSSWTKAEVKQGQDVSAFLARLFVKPDLKIEQIDPVSFKKGLQNLRNWFVSLCRDNRTLGLMVYTDDAGPFFGEEVAAERLGALKVLESIPIPDRQARFVLMQDRGAREPIVIGVVNDDGSVRWLRRLIAAPSGRVTSASFMRRTIYEVDGYGYVCPLMAEWDAGLQQSPVYLDESLNLRFYFIAL